MKRQTGTRSPCAAENGADAPEACIWWFESSVGVLKRSTVREQAHGAAEVMRMIASPLESGFKSARDPAGPAFPAS